MNITRTRALIFIACLLACGMVVSCSGPRIKAKSEKPAMPNTQFLSTMYDTNSFNTGVTQLPPMYAGHNPELLYTNIGMRKQRAQRFPSETDQQYALRVGYEITLPLMGSLDFDSIYAFRITPAKIIYNAKERVMQVRCDLRPVMEAAGATSKRAFMVRYQPQLDNAYMIKNKDGTSKTIEERKFSEYSVIPVNDISPAHLVNDGFEVSFAMNPDDAKKYQGSMNVLIIGSLATPYISYNEINRAPTVEHAGTYLARYHYLHIKLLDIWIYDATSGKIPKRVFG